MQYNYIVKPVVVSKVRQFYRNVQKKYRNTYSYQDRLQYINRAVDNIGAIEQTLPRRRPTLQRWQRYHMAKADNWYYAYTIEGDTIIIQDACHAQNMHENL